jgi:hypothetical protein
LIHAHSIEAYHSEQPRLSRRALAILAWLAEHGAATDREIVNGMGFSDMNCVRPRVTEAIESGALVEVGEKRCSMTGKNVRIVDLSLDQKGRGL